MNINASMNTDENNLTEVQETNNNQCEYSLEELNKELSAFIVNPTDFNFSSLKIIV